MEAEVNNVGMRHQIEDGVCLIESKIESADGALQEGATKADGLNRMNRKIEMHEETEARDPEMRGRFELLSSFLEAKDEIACLEANALEIPERGLSTLEVDAGVHVRDRQRDMNEKLWACLEAVVLDMLEGLQTWQARKDSGISRRNYRVWEGVRGESSEGTSSAARVACEELNLSELVNEAQALTPARTCCFLALRQLLQVLGGEVRGFSHSGTIAECDFNPERVDRELNIALAEVSAVQGACASNIAKTVDAVEAAEARIAELEAELGGSEQQVKLLRDIRAHSSSEVDEVATAARVEIAHLKMELEARLGQVQDSRRRKEEGARRNAKVAEAVAAAKAFYAS